MIQAPYIKVVIQSKSGDNIDISDRISKFTYEESTEKDNMVELEIISKYVELMIDVEDIQEGSTLLYKFGYVNGASSPTHKVVLTDIEHNFEHRNINMKVRGLDKGTVLKKTTSPQIYENVTSTDIAKLIATRHGLDINVDNTTKVWDKQPQGNLDDLTFLRKLASQEKSGNYIVYIKDGVLNFVRRGLDKPSLITYTYGEGNNGILKFKPRWRESTASPASVGSSATGFDPFNGLFDTGKETAESENETITTGDYHLVYSADGEHLANGTDNENFSVQEGGILDDITSLVGNQSVDGSPDFEESGLGKIVKTGKQFISGAIGQDLSNKVAGTSKSGKQKILEGSLSVVGNPLLKINNLLTLANVTKRYNGNWYITTCKHSISSSGYTTELTLNRNGSKKAIQGKNTKKANLPNDSVGDRNGIKDEVVVLAYDANGNRVADVTQADNYIPPQEL